MKNLTISIPDEVYRQARVRAAEEGSSVSALVADYLRALVARDAEFARLEAEQERIRSQIESFRAGDRLDREALHSRDLR